MNANFTIIFCDFLKINYLDLSGLWFGRQCFPSFLVCKVNYCFSWKFLFFGFVDYRYSNDCESSNFQAKNYTQSLTLPQQLTNYSQGACRFSFTAQEGWIVEVEIDYANLSALGYNAPSISVSIKNNSTLWKYVN